MELLGALGLLTLVSLTQIQYIQAQACTITSITSPDASSLSVTWTSFVGATNYFLDLRVINATDIAPVVVSLPASSTQRVVHGLRPGTAYSVTVKVFQFYYVMCLDTKISSTVPGTSQITYSRALSSTAIRLEWSRVEACDRYFLVVNSTTERYNLTFTGLSGVVERLQPATAYDCYVYASNVAGLGGRSRVRTISTLVQPPEVVSAQQTGRRSARVTWQPVDRVLLYVVTIRDVYNSTAAPFSRNVSTTSLDVQDILPCSSYQISVSSVNSLLEPGEPRQLNYTTNTLSPVTSVSVEYSCHSGSAIVSWGIVFGANSYRAVAVGSGGNNGTVLSCTSTGTQCQLTGLRCGQSYTVHVTAISENCESTANGTANFETVPCPPSSLDLFRECSSNVIIFSWAPTNHTAFYVARAVDSANQRMECMTSDTSCFFTNTVCGRTYEFTVSSVTGECSSGPSAVVEVQTAPCQPRNMRTSAACQSDVLTSTWDGADGALLYVVEASGNKQNHYNCSSQTNSCAIPGVQCGEALTMFITAYDNECPSERTLGEVAETVPCVPQNLSAVMDCGADSISLRWQYAPGALFYVATVTDELGSTHSCRSMDTHCQVAGLRCGATYSAHVMSSTLSCNSSMSEVIAVETAPCPPDHVQAFLDCAANQALIMWRGARSMTSFTATIQDQSGGLLSCSTTMNSCRIPDLKCGQVYDVSVTHHDGICPSMPSQPIRMESVPCGPTNVQPRVDCGSGVLTMSWNETEGAEGYITMVTSSNGQHVYCNSTEPECSLNTLECGMSYTVEVQSFNGTCLSMPSQTVPVREVPCVPTAVLAQRSCGDSLVAVTWNASRGAQFYTVVAVSSDGHRTECSSNTTACSLSDLHCSQVYSISVMAVDDTCSSLQSTSVTLQTVPCPPTNVHSLLNCSTNMALLTWDASPNAVSYTGQATGRDGHSLSCEVSGRSCQLSGLRCGQGYVFSVSATDGTCRSPDSVQYRQETAPCAPQNVSSALHCGTNMLTVSWSPGATALNYTATARTRNGSSVSCTSRMSSCNIQGLQCGQVYTVVVTATNGNCQGPESAPQTVQTVPCMPRSVSGRVQCTTNTLQVAWARSAGALSYTSVVTGVNGYRESCSTSDLSCSFRGLMCAQTYNFSVVAHDNQCNSTASSMVSVVTAPCIPQNVRAGLQCGSGVVSVSWNASAGARAYTVLAGVRGQAPNASCRTTGTSCRLTQLHCGEMFNISVLAEDGTCNSTAHTNTALHTAPCAPRMEAPSLDCTTNHALVSWVRDQDALGVTVNATSDIGHHASCSSTNTSCELNQLLCGHTYTVQGTAQGQQCDSVPSSPFNLVTVPCTPVAVRADYTCGTGIALLSWDESLGRQGFHTTVSSASHSDSCTTTETTCSITSLHCGSLYNVSVASLAGHCNSSQRAMTQLQTAPCPPRNVSASLLCGNNTASVSWLGSPGAVSYNVTALGRHGDTKSCHTSDTGCRLSNMQCGETYNVLVTPYSQTCHGFPSTTYTYTAGPCPPTGIEVSLQCAGNVGSVNWDPVANAEMYIATATGEDGHTHTCTSNTTSCSFFDLHCGENYAITLVTVERGCHSEPSATVNLRSAVCPPSGLSGVTDCATNDLTITWQASPVTGVTYHLLSQLADGTNTTVSTDQTSHALAGLHCGMRFTFRVATQDSVCTSQFSPPFHIDTAPCSPTNLSASADCGTNLGSVTWHGGAGATSYVAEFVGTHGHRVSCTSNSTSCSARLDCGHHYTATLVSSTGQCNTSAQNSIEFDSAPCLPANVMADLNCTTNMLAVQWQESEGNPESYTALAIAADGTRASCNTSSTSCTIPSLRCGRTYSVVVTTSTVDCGVIDGSDYQIQTAPCKPENPTVDLDCSTNVAMVMWDSDAVEQFYMVSALNFTGGRTVCNSTQPNCNFTHLSCGESYTLSVVGLTEQCTSEPSTMMNLNTAPCVPTHVIADVDCQTSITTVTWDSARGAERYTVHAVGNHGHNSTCINTDTNCAFSDLWCGQDYTITVIAEHSSCVSTASQPITASTGPCPHSNLHAVLDCSSNTALVSWTSGNGTLNYNATAEGFSTAHLVACSTPGSACNITDLQCGQRYRVSVRGQGRTCPSPARDWLAIDTAPCPPTNVNVHSSCDSDAVSVSWETSLGSLSYMAVAEVSGGHRATCNSSGTACDISGLLCGQTYEVFVVGVDDNCVGEKSEVQTVRTAPCMPQHVQTHLECQTGVLNVTWQQSGDANHYHATVESSQGHVMVCDTDEPTCVFADLRCNLTYSVVVVAHDETCNSSHSPTQHITTAPCPPETISAVMDCETSVLSVSWTPSVQGVVYTAVASLSPDHYYTCNSTATACDITGLACGTEYNVTVVPHRNGCVGTKPPCQMTRTAPCVPVLTEVEMDCLSDSAWVVWEESAGAELYVATATDSEGRVYQCNSTESQCAVPELLCGKHYNFSLTASDGQCTSATSNTVESETAPCAPQGVLASADCESRTVSVSWEHSYGALSYTATLERTDGDTTCCTTHNSSCDVAQLPCGEMYVLTVTAEGRTCNSSQTPGTIVRTAPCIPSNLQGSVSCSSNVADMTWNLSRGGQVYTVNALSEDGHSATCTAFGGSCELTTLSCGQHYTATVVAQDSTCGSPPSVPTEIRTVPCVPQNVSTAVDCLSNVMSVFWEQSDGADSYTATLTDSDGRSTNCQGMDVDSCNISGLACGKLYHVSVVASDGYCDSQPSDVATAHSVPCMPRDIRAVMDCHTGTAVLSWYMSQGAVSYMARAESVSGHAVSCETNHTNCELGDLACGEQYTVSVLATGETCSSLAQMNGLLETGPCVPQYVNVQYALSIGQLSWDRSRGATSYSAEAVTEQGLMSSCQTNDTSCVLLDMACGQIYNFTVTAHNRACGGIATSEPITLETEPCPPNQVEAHVECSTGAGVMSWEASNGAVAYQAVLEGFAGDTLTCLTTDTSCNVQGILCGTRYYARVRAIGRLLNSSDSVTVVLNSVPCSPDTGSLVVDVDCENDTSLVSWDWSNGGDSYELTAVGTDGYLATCTSTENYCSLTELVCGQTYTLSLTAVSDTCQVQSESNVTFQTRPCTPQRVAVNLQCGSDTAVLSWEHREHVNYVASASLSTGGPAEYCNTTGDSCSFAGLSCGSLYYFSVTAVSDECQSEPSNTVEIRTGPCQPEQVTVEGSCDRETVELSWEEAPGAQIYTVVAVGDLGYETAFQTSNASLETELPCGQTYRFTVTGQDEMCASAPSTPAEFRTAPCIPQHMDTYFQCEDSLGSVSWGDSDGAESYTAIAVGQDGHTHMCTTNGTTCTWDDLHCGEIYTVQVIANHYLCSSLPSNRTTIHMAPCTPQGLVSSMDCGLKVGSLSWNASTSAQLYLVVAEANSGHRVELTTNSTNAHISEFNCGQEYYLTVSAIGQTCRSSPSSPSVLQSEPCSPAAVSTSMDCFSNIAVVTWMAAPGAEYYTATVVDADGQSVTCMSTDTRCGMPNLLCGETYSVSVTASSRLCNSTPTVPTDMNTAPCVPTNVSVVMDCANNEAHVSWRGSQGALSYHAVAESSRGVLSSCESVNTSCTLGNLTCGAPYSVQVTAVGHHCSSLRSQAAEFNTVPCTPVISAGHLDCYTDSVLLEWAFAEGSLHYTAVAQATNGHISTCSTNYTNCELMDLACGQLYTVTMVASDGQCNSSQSTGLEVQSVPCSPQNVVTVLSCSANSAHVQWDPSSGAEYYEVHAVGTEGHVTGCETSDTNCVVHDLMCSYTYNISVVAVRDMCNVSESAVTQLNSVPCAPQHVEANLDCDSGVVAVSWESSYGAISYTTLAHGDGGSVSECHTNSTVCEFSSLLCGETYSITVSASDNVCSSSQSYSVRLNTVPCEPLDITAHMECSSNTGLVSWQQGEGVSSYLVRAAGPDGHRTQCNSTLTSCSLPNLHCGQSYNITVTAQDSQCDSNNAYLILPSTPCAPTSVRASLLCHSNSAAVNWERASGAQWYHARGTTLDGHHVAHCNASLTHCDLDNLRCGQTYNVSVYSQDESCSSAESAVAQVQTAPCPPQDVLVQVDCAASSMTVTWAANPDAESFRVEAVTATGSDLSCNSTGTSCTITNLSCGNSYSVTVMAIRDGCESEPSAAVHASSAPCVPQSEIGSLDCVTNSAWVSWELAAGAESYTVLALSAGGHNSSCTTSGITCNVPDLQCGVLYTFHITAANAQCHSGPSGTFQIQTAPCALKTITTETECHSSVIRVGWELNEESPMYVATAEGHDLSILTCNSTTTSCELIGARCGMQYTIIVSASSDKCSSLRSPPQHIQTAPCAPEDVTVEPVCEPQGVSVSWTPSLVALSYTVTATGRDGDVRTCETDMSNCTMLDLHCGQPYTFHLTASSENCTSPASMGVSHQTVPCDPGNLTVAIQCETNSAMLSWEPSEGSVEYYACAQNDEGDMLYCDTMGTSCTVEGLECGAVYNFSVQASDGMCNGSFSPPLVEGAVPCAPLTVQAVTRLMGEATLLMVSWSSVGCPDVEYLVEVTGRIHDDPQSLMDLSAYWTEYTFFEFLLPCSTTYSLTVRTRNSAGTSEPSEVHTGVTIPCPPAVVTFAGNDTSAVVSWQASTLATEYTVYQETMGGRRPICSTTDLSCQVSGLRHDAVQVTASNSAGESAASTVPSGANSNRRRRDLRGAEMLAGLKERDELSIPEVTLVRVTGMSVHVEWGPVRGASYYTLIIREDMPSRPPREVLTVYEEAYTVTDLKSATRYCFTLSAKNSITQSAYCQPVCVTTE